MPSDIENLLDNIRREGHEPAPRLPRSRLAILTGSVGAAAILISTGLLAFGAVATLATPQPSAAEPAVAPISTTETVAAPVQLTEPEVPTASAEIPAFLPDGVTPLYTAATDVSTIPLPTDQPESEIANAKVWITQQSIIAGCLAEQGSAYAFTPYWLKADSGFGADQYHPSPGTDGWLAEYGSPDQPAGEDYDWRQAGCTGYAVHVTGMDDAN